MAENIVNTILNKLNNPIDAERYRKLYKIDKNFEVILLIRTNQFLDYFTQYLNNSEFKERVFEIIKISYEICDNVDDIMDILLKTSIVNLIDVYINYSKIGQKETVLNILGASFGTLSPGPQILNVCLMVDPIFKREDYLEDKKRSEEVEITYDEAMSEEEIEIKSTIDSWLKSQKIDPENQEIIAENLKLFLKNLAQSKGIDLNSGKYKKLESQCIEMLAMRVIALSLVAELDDDDLSPLSIN